MGGSRGHATTLVINPKGGSGKTTVAINLASYFAAQGVRTAIVDYDPQGSSLNWLNLRSASQNPIVAANAAPQKTGLRTMRMHIPPETQQLVIDAPAGATGLCCRRCCPEPIASCCRWRLRRSTSTPRPTSFATCC